MDLPTQKFARFVGVFLPAEQQLDHSTVLKPNTNRGREEELVWLGGVPGEGLRGNFC